MGESLNGLVLSFMWRIGADGPGCALRSTSHRTVTGNQFPVVPTNVPW